MALEGRTAVVTGAAQGIGRSISEILLKNGAKVALLDVAEATGTTLKKSLDGQYGPERTLFIPCDVQSQQQFKAALQKVVETFGHLDIFCNNAGIANENDWEKTVSINLMGVVRGSYLALEHMNKLSGGQGGVIINIASLAGLGPLPGAPIYTATKHGVVGFTRAMAETSKRSGYGVRFNTICPDFAKTDILNYLDSTATLGQFAHLADPTRKFVEQHGLLDVSQVSEAFLQLVFDETKDGASLMVLLKGSQYYTSNFLEWSDI
ncbi:15-hydroxyprostaglandin dehydrogenase [NAD(+)]-like [Gadus macrocephalus]|uniref:15-hydroxyprostaglandin dehydrogenase [NAD(+)]-like n=1 Tax=Gadus macrocephalus TaxID=80720 RepID=UPI0028CB5BBD|nr:15-hydroxyprostaglandin dehydrogenase [NAD(+)]-like [Gadus macrocephalus]